MRNITLVIIIMFLFGCGYSSIYQNQKTQNFQINVTNIKGDEVMNNLIKNQIKLYSNKKSNKIYNLTIDTIYVKDILTKNSSGVITDYTLSVTSIFSIDLNNQTKIFKFKEKINIKNQTDTFEQNIYEKNIKRNFASSIKEKLISAILSLNDN